MVGVKAASLTIMVGGSDEAFSMAKPLFALMGKNITLVGSNGDGQTTKVANQIIVALAIEAVGEALLLASKAPTRRRCDKRSWWLRGIPHSRCPRRADDQSDIYAGVSQLGISLPNTATAQELFNACVANGGKGRDHSAMPRALELMANSEVGRQ